MPPIFLRFERWGTVRICQTAECQPSKLLRVCEIKPSWIMVKIDHAAFRLKLYLWGWSDFTLVLQSALL